MSQLRTAFRTATVASLATVAAFGVGAAAPALASAGPCQVTGGTDQGDMPNEWSLIVTFRSKGLTCAAVKPVLNVCAARTSVPGWRISDRNGKTQFTNRARPSKRFIVMGVGGVPRCLDR